MGKTISASIVDRISRGLGQDKNQTLPMLASLTREGADHALRRFPEHRGRLLREASILRERNLLDVPDIDGQRFETSGLWWTVTPPAGFENFQMVAHDRDSKRTHMRVSFVAHDLAVGWNSGEDLFRKEKGPEDIERDPVLRMAIGRAIAPAARAYLERVLRNRQGMTGYFRRHLKAVCNNIFSLNHLVPNMSLQVRKAPHLQGEEAHKMLVSASFSGTFELAMFGRGTGEMFEGVEVQHDANYFEIAGGVQTILHGAKQVKGEAAEELESLASDIEAVTPRQRRKQEKEVLMKGPPKALNTEVVTLTGDDEDMKLEIDGPATIIQVLEAGLKDEAKVAHDWWRAHKGLIKPSLTELATKAIAEFGEGVSIKDVPLLVDISLPRLQKVASKRQSQFTEFGFDAAVVGLGQLLRHELSRRLR